MTVGRMYIVAALHGKPFTLWNVKCLSDVIYQATRFDIELSLKGNEYMLA